MRIFSKRGIGLMAGLVLGVGLAATAMVRATPTWGPARTLYTWDQPVDHIQFNSFTNNPNYGDERFLLKGGEASASTTSYTDSAQVSDGEEMVLRVYFHNNAESHLNLHAQNTKVKIQLPTQESASMFATGTISADNASPTSVFSTMHFTSDSPFTMEYMKGSTHVHTGYFDTDVQNDDVVNGGLLVGSKSLNGDVPGCYQFSGYVTIHVKIHKKVTPPVYSCNLLNVSIGDNRKVNGSVTFTA